ncbi:hypothetical protein BT93_B1887 [Corymbia citriodora subsp. variegata]|nr:hypothetical protein BT93_B1887 [Corymbia citriodora subsp. variegata]
MSMDLEYPDEFLASGHDQHSQIAKGKRTKRQRPASPSGCAGGGAASMTSCSSSGGGGGRGGGGGGGGDASSALSPSSSGNNVVYSSAEEEEEDLANCLILLAQGDGRPTRADCDDDGGGKMGIFSSKKFSEVVAAVGGGGAATARAGFYVYECKTCSRVFPSFQALGGHRASHKKPKSSADPDQKIKPSAVVLGLDANDDDDEGHSGKLSQPLSVHVAGPKGLHQSSKPKIHECNICGSEFASGQALGGHMRRHRSTAPATATSANVTSPTDPPPAIGEKSRSVLSLDLNLPAPPEEDHHHQQAHRRRETSKFQFTTSQQPIILASPALVDCHY